MNIGRKIYYELNTGNVILTTETRSDSVVETTIDQDFTNYSSLQPYQQSAVGMIQLEFGGQDEINSTKYPCHIDITQNPPGVAWDTVNPLGASLSEVQILKIAQVRDLAAQSLYTTVTSNGVIYNYSADGGYPAFQKLLLGMVAGIISYPYTLYDVNHTAVSFDTVDALKLLFQDISVRENAINTKINDYVTQIKACGSVDDVNKIVVSF